MKKSLYILCICCCIQNCFAQTFLPDSLNQGSIKTAFLSQKVDFFNLLACSLGQKNAKHAQQQERYAQQSLKLAEELSYTKGQVDALHQIGLSYYRRKAWAKSVSYFAKALEMLQLNLFITKKASLLNLAGVSYTYLNKFDIALKHIHEALYIYQSLQHQPGIAHSLVCQARVFIYQHRYQESLTLLFQALKIYQGLQNQQEVVHVLIKIGKVYREMSNTPGAIKHFLQALDLLETMDDPRLMALVYRKLSSLYNLLDQDNDSLEYLFKALKIYRTLGDDFLITNVLSQITHRYFKLKNYSMTIHYGQKAHKLGKQFGHHSKAMWVWGIVGLAYGGQHKYDKAVLMVNKAIKLMKGLNKEHYQAFLLIHLGKMYISRQETEAGEKCLKSGIALAKQGKIIKYVMIGTKELYQIYKQRKNTAKALKYLEQYTAIHERILSQKKTRLVASLYHAHQMRKKQLENTGLKQALYLKQQQIRQERLILWLTVGGLALFLSGIVGLFLGFRKIRKSNRLLRAQQAQILLTNTRLQQNEEEIRSKAETIAQQRDRLADANQSLQENAQTMSRQKEQLEVTLQQVEELGIFKEKMMSMVTHDLKNPLSAIIGLSETNVSITDQHMIHKSGKRMMHLIHNLLDTQKLKEPYFQTQKCLLDLGNLSTQAIEQVQWLAQAKKIPICHVIENSFTVMADPDLLLRVLVNLLHNALSYTDGIGRVTICYEFATTDFVKIKVMDTGIGIASEDLPFVFEPYCSSKKNQTSTGLGLTFCKMAIEAQEGQIGVESKPGKGSVFWVRLPLVNRAAQMLPSFLQQNYPTPDDTFLEVVEHISLQPYLKQLKQCSMNNLTGVNAIIDQIDVGECPHLQAWKAELQMAVFSLDQSRYRALIDM